MFSSGARRLEVARLQQLRVSVFGNDDADMIREEEQSGFYRFGHNRELGKE